MVYLAKMNQENIATKPLVTVLKNNRQIQNKQRERERLCFYFHVS